jgi:cytochrome c
MAIRAASQRRLVTAMALAAVVFAASEGALAGADLELGRYLASECMTCHRAQTTASSIPNLSHVPPAHFIQVIKAYRAKELPNPAMQSVASRLSDDDIESLALYFSTAKQP